jgi:hypothetical protein
VTARPTAGLSILLLIPTLASTPRLAVAAHPNVQVSSPTANAPEEVTVTVDPANPLRLAGGANIRYGYRSFDGGLTWIENVVTSSLGTAGDPVMLYGGLGDLYYAHLSHLFNGPFYDRMVVQRSADGGATWNDGAGIGLNPPKMQDKPGLAVDLTSSPHANNVYLAWTEFDEYGSINPADSTRVLFSRSLDSGQTWSAPVRVSDAGGNAEDGSDTVEGAIPAVGPQGQVYLAWSGPGGIHFDRSLDGGATFGQDVFVASQPGGWNFGVSGISRCNGLPTTLSDISSSPHRGNVYVVWSDQRAGADDTDVFLARSTDGGQTWGSAVRVNDDATTRHQFFPAAAIDPTTGFLYIAYYDRRGTIGTATDVTLSRSADGGQTFHAVAVSDLSFTPDPSVFFGDYIGLAAWNQVVYPMWMRMDGFTLSVWTTRVSDAETVVSVPASGPATTLALHGAFPNPFRSTTRLSYALAAAGPVSVRIVDVAGRQVATLVNGVQEAGEHRIEWNAGGQSAGLYFYAVAAGGTTRAGKLIVTR